MTVHWAHDRRLNQAFLASLVLHLFVAMLIPAVVVLNGDTSTVETISFARLIHVRVATPKPVMRPIQAVAPKAGHPPRVSHHAAAQAALRAPRVLPTKGLASQAATVQSIARAGHDTTVASTAAPVAAATPAVQSTGESPAHEVGGYMPLGAEQPVPVLDPSVHEQLAALKVHVTLIVTVGDDGHTKSVVFQPPLDTITEMHIRAMLATASWDPATCGGGVPCQANATITL